MSEESENFKSIVECIRDFVKKCPYLSEFHRGIGVDYLAEDTQSYMIEAVPCNPIVKRYVSGQSVRQFQFYFASRETYSKNVLDNLENCAFYERFQNWLEECTKNDDLPELTGGKVAREIMATTHGYVFDAEQSKAQYMIQCNLIYFCP